MLAAEPVVFLDHAATSLHVIAMSFVPEEFRGSSYTLKL